MAELEMRILGGIEATRDGRPVALGRPQQLRVFGALLAARGGAVGADMLADALWPSGAVPTGWERALRSYVSRLRGALGAERIVHGLDGYRLDRNRLTIDSVVFEERIAGILPTASPAVPPAAEAQPRAENDTRWRSVEALDDALRIWRGPAFGAMHDEPWAHPWSASLDELRFRAVELRLTILLGLGRHRDIVGELRQVVSAEPCRARPVELLTHSLARSERQPEALRAYQEHRRVLRDGTGLSPSPTLQALERDFATGCALADQRASPELPPALRFDRSTSALYGRDRRSPRGARPWQSVPPPSARALLPRGCCGVGPRGPGARPRIRRRHPFRRVGSAVPVD